MQVLQVTAMTSNAGDRVSLVNPGVTCVVGGNNAGKSQILRELLGVCESNPPRLVALANVDGVRPHTTMQGLEAWLKSVGSRVQVGGVAEPLRYVPVAGGQAMSAHEAFSLLSQERLYLGPLRGFFLWYASAGSLLHQATGSLGSSPGMDQAAPLARLFRDGALEGELSALAESAFGIKLVLDRVNADVRLRVGEVDVPVPPLNRPTREYADAVAALPSLEEQGDGMKSFLGLALMVVAGEIPILVIDEPEAFLHPAQARSLGRWLAAQATKRNLQIIVATHDRDFVLGLLDSHEDENVSVIRVTRAGSETRLRQLRPEEIRVVWGDAVLRYSNVLQGLFYRRVCVCEGDADCRFYWAVLDALAADRRVRADADDVLFVPSGGKERVATLVRALTSLGIEAYGIVDFDALKRRALVSSVVEAAGGAWTAEMDNDYVAMTAPINAGQLWSSVKTQGLAAVPAGEPNAAAVRLLAALGDARVLVVPVGEMEGFDKTIASEGAGWVSAMLEQGGHKTCLEARRLVGKIVDTPVDEPAGDGT